MTDAGADPEELLSHDGLVRALARDLTRNAQEAEDLAQDAWVAALWIRSAPPRSWPLWLAGVARRLAARRARSEARRRARERRVSRGESGPSVLEIRAREEARREVVEALLELEEPYRGTLLLRYFDNLPPREIARRQGVPVETVRTRTRRGLARLRARLDQAHGGRRDAWCAGLLPLALLSGAVPAAADQAVLPTLFSKLTLMSTQAKLTLAGVLLLGTALLLLKLGGGTDSTPARGQDGAAGALAPLSEDLAARGAASSAPLGASTLEPAARQAVAPNAPAADAAPGTGSLRVQVRWESDGQAAEGEYVRVHAWGADSPYFRTLELRTDQAGIALFPRVAAGKVTAEVHRASGRRGALGLEVKAGEEAAAELVIPVGIEIEGEVVDAAGLPVPEAEIWVSHHGTMTAGLVLGQSGPDGRFVLRSVGSGHWIGARKAGYAPSLLPMVVAADGVRVPLRLVLPGAGGAVAGRVTDPEGKPVAGAAVHVGSDEPKHVSAPDGTSGYGMPGVRTAIGPDGRFLATGLPLGPTPVRVRAEGWGLWRGEAIVEALGTTLLEIRLQPGVELRGHVYRGEAGEPAVSATVTTGGWGFEHFQAQAGAELRVRVVDEAGNGRPACGIQIVGGASAGGSPHFDLQTTGADGRARFENCPEGEYNVEVQAPGGGLFLVARRSGVRPGPEELLIRVSGDIEPSVHLVGVVLDPEGEPAGACTVNPVYSAGASPIATVDPSTGRFELGPYPAGEWRLWIRHPEYPDHHFGPRQLARGETWDLGEIRLAEGGTLAVVLNREAGAAELEPEIGLLVNGRVDTRSLSLENEVARSRPLQAGAYELVVGGAGVAGQSLPFEIRAGQETLLNVILRPGVPCRVAVAEEPATELRQVEIELRDPAGELVFRRPVYRRGGPDFQHDFALVPGTYLVRVHARDGRSAADRWEVPVSGEPAELRLLLPALAPR